MKTTNIASSDVVSLQFICGIIMEYSWMLMLQLISIYKPSLPPLHSHFLQLEEAVEAINCLLWIENINKPHITQLLSKWQTCIIILYCLTRGLLMSNLCLNTNWAPLNAWSTILVGIESAFNYLRSVPRGIKPHQGKDAGLNYYIKTSLKWQTAHYLWVIKILGLPK